MIFTRVLAFLCCLLGAPSLYALAQSPWLPPPLLFEGQAAYLYERTTEVESPLETVVWQSDTHSLLCGLGFSFWPQWHIDTHVFLTQTRDISFTYEAALCTLRYAWLDDSDGDLLALTTGISCSFPGSRYLHTYNFAYHGLYNGEIQITLGREWASRSEWCCRGWVLGGAGLAEKGSPWLHGLGVLDGRISQALAGSLFVEALYGLGDKDIIPGIPFTGYAPISHRSIDVGAQLSLLLPYVGRLSLQGWYNVYAQNFISHYWGGTLSLLIPFSIHNDDLLLTLFSLFSRA